MLIPRRVVVGNGRDDLVTEVSVASLPEMAAIESADDVWMMVR